MNEGTKLARKILTPPYRPEPADARLDALTLARVVQDLEARVRELEAHRAAALEMSQRQRDRVRELEDAVSDIRQRAGRGSVVYSIATRALVPANEETAE